MRCPFYRRPARCAIVSPAPELGASRHADQATICNCGSSPEARHLARLPEAAQLRSRPLPREAAFAATVVVTEPPACSTAAFAVAEAPETVMVIAREIVPSPSSRMPSLSLDARPAAIQRRLGDRLRTVDFART